MLALQHPKRQARQRTAGEGPTGRGLYFSPCGLGPSWVRPQLWREEAQLQEPQGGRTIRNRQGISLRNTPDSRASTWPPT